MELESNAHEIREKFDELMHHKGDWTGYLALTTAIITVVAAVAALMSGDFANRALLEKNNALLEQNRASDQWGYYQAKGIKANIAEGFAHKKDADRYKSEQAEIKSVAEDHEKSVAEHNEKSAHLLEKHHHAALSVTFLQIAIALSAMSALMNRKSLWALSIAMTLVALFIFAQAIF